MLLSTNIFTFDDGGDKDSNEVLMRHIVAGAIIVSSAKRAKFKFGKGIGNLKKQQGESGLDHFEAVNNDPLAEMFCLEASNLVLKTGGSDICARVDSIHIPEDAAYVNNNSNMSNDNNLKFVKTYGRNPTKDEMYRLIMDKDWLDGLEGQNLIYIGSNLYWGRTSGTKIQTLLQWTAHVGSWKSKSGKQAKVGVESSVNYPGAGLK